MSKKIYDLAVKTGTYMKDGTEKGRYKNIGIVMEQDDGGKFILLDRSFNPAGVPFKEGSETIMVSMFKPDGAKQQAQTPAPQNKPEDEIPF